MSENRLSIGERKKGDFRASLRELKNIVFLIIRDQMDW